MCICMFTYSYESINIETSLWKNQEIAKIGRLKWKLSDMLIKQQLYYIFFQYFIYVCTITCRHLKSKVGLLTIEYACAVTTKDIKTFY